MAANTSVNGQHGNGPCGSAACPAPDAGSPSNKANHGTWIIGLTATIQPMQPATGQPADEVKREVLGR